MTGLMRAACLLLFLSFCVAAQTASPTPARPVSAPSPAPTVGGLPASDAAPLTLQEAVDLAVQQISAYRGSVLNSEIAAQDVIQAKSAYRPRVSIPLGLIYTTPSLGPDRPRPPSFLGANATTEFQTLINAAGEIDTSGRLKATLNKNRALFESARAGSEVARNELIRSATDAYYAFSLAATRRGGAESNLAVALEFENNTKLNVDAGEVAPIDLVRARLQTEVRRDELEQAKTEETVTANALRFLVGRDFAQPISATDLLTDLPVPDEIERFTTAAIQSRPEFAQFSADLRAAEQDVNIARAERRPQFTYSVSAGLVTDSFRPAPIRNHAGAQATIGFTIPIFDGGASRSRETQARLRVQLAQNQRAIAERQFAQDFFSARTEALSSRERIRLVAGSVRDAETNVNTSIARYRAGEGPISEVIDAQNLLISQKQALYKAIFDYQTAKSRLARAAGR